ncbi:hypothetical protein BZG01_18340 [Labilibaculum manganireducens]|uniref:DUF2946 domain-containing protein n=1 Tax=Labilibaculum manganireducens TaxID=1940525 RepID=A0A2N3HV12_9BACT|nr:hypothetical protein [Labilibaculum manganireducens]PKQ61892.1 hypothetical protein BZG01_18340 [Labilibaculum manganireducens]
MIKLRKHIAFILFVIFFFPITFQSVHIVWHHAHGYKCEHHLCHAESSDKNSHTSTENLSEKENACPICEYQFSINNLPELSVIKSEIPVLAYSYNQVAAVQQYVQVFSNKTPRAPPILVS